MVTYLKQGKSDADVAEADAKVRGIVEDILSDIEKRGDAAVRELSEKFDGSTREEFRLSEDEIKAAVSKVPQTDIEDIEFAQNQVRNFAQKQKAFQNRASLHTLHFCSSSAKVNYASLLLSFMMLASRPRHILPLSLPSGRSPKHKRIQYTGPKVCTDFVAKMYRHRKLYLLKAPNCSKPFRTQILSMLPVCCR